MHLFTHISTNVADPAGVDILWHVVALVGRVRLEPLGVDLALVEEGVTAIAGSETPEISGSWTSITSVLENLNRTKFSY